MSKKMMMVFMLLAMLAGFIGGTFGDRLVLAAKGKTVVIGQEFRLMDGRGVVRASLGLNPQGEMAVTLHDAQGKPTENMVVTPGMIKASKEDRGHDAQVGEDVLVACFQSREAGRVKFGCRLAGIAPPGARGKIMPLLVDQGISLFKQPKPGWWPVMFQAFVDFPQAFYLFLSRKSSHSCAKP